MFKSLHENLFAIHNHDDKTGEIIYTESDLAKAFTKIRDGLIDEQLKGNATLTETDINYMIGAQVFADFVAKYFSHDYTEKNLKSD